MSCDTVMLTDSNCDAQVYPCGEFELVLSAPDPDKPIREATIRHEGQPIHEDVIDFTEQDPASALIRAAIAKLGLDDSSGLKRFVQVVMTIATAGAKWRAAHRVKSSARAVPSDSAAPVVEEAPSEKPIAVGPESIDAFVNRWREKLEPNWGHAKFGAYLDELLIFLGQPHDLTTTGFECLLAAVNQSLKQCSYPVQTLPAIRRKLKQMAEVRREREKALRDRTDGEGQEVGTPSADVPARFVLLSAQPKPPNASAEDSSRIGILDRKADGELITNFEPVIEEDLTLEDENESQRVFAGTIRLGETTSPFRISAEDFASNAKLQEKIFAAAGPRVEIRCKPDLLRQAISTISTAVIRRRTTTSFGWTKDPQAYLVPGGKITAEGFQPAGSGDDCRVDLSGCAMGTSLDLRPLPAEEVKQLKEHLVADWLPSHDRRVTYSLLGTIAAALLYPFLNEAGRYTLWLSGLTGTGKSFQARLAQHFFGDFGGIAGKVQTWGSTANYIQTTGYFFRHALYLVDDYKPSANTQSQLTQVLQVLQAYGDNTARGRLRADASFLGQRPIRGFLVSTGEDVPEHSASTIARSILIDVPQQPKELARGQRCIAQCGRYSAITADFIRWLLVKKETAKFKRRFQKLRGWFYRGIAGQQNDLRIASNFALLAAAFWLAAKYLGEVWPGWRKEVKTFIGKDLIAVRDRMLGAVKEQQESEVFLDTLRELVQWGQVKVTNHHVDNTKDHAPTIGKIERTGSCQAVFLSVAMALGEVQKNLRDRGRPVLRATEQTLIGQLRQDGHLLEEKSRNRRLDGQQTKGVLLPLTVFDPTVPTEGRPSAATNGQVRTMAAAILMPRSATPTAVG